jgi:hypothetical protein
MTVALLLAAAPDRLSAMTQPYRQPGDRMPGGPTWIDGVGGRLMSAGVRQVDVAMCADAADGLRAVAAAARDVVEPMLVCTTTRALSTPGGALATLLRGSGTAALPASGALLVAREDLAAVAEAAEALAARVGSAGRPHRILRRTRVSGELNDAVDSLIESIAGLGIALTLLDGQEARGGGQPPRVPAGAANGARPAGRPSRGSRTYGLVGALLAPLASSIARWAAARGLAPVALSTAALALSVCAAAWFAAAGKSSLVTGSVLLAAVLPLRQAAVSGARSAFGDWAAAVSGAAAEYAVYAGLAVGWTAARPHQAWEFAIAAMAVLAVRQMTGVGYPPRREHPGSTHRLLRMAGQSITLPAGERMVLIAVSAPIWGTQAALTVLIGWGAVALGYSLAERAVASRVPGMAGDAAASVTPSGVVRDDGA